MIAERTIWLSLAAGAAAIVAASVGAALAVAQPLRVLTAAIVVPGAIGLIAVYFLALVVSIARGATTRFVGATPLYLWVGCQLALLIATVLLLAAWLLALLLGAPSAAMLLQALLLVLVVNGIATLVVGALVNLARAIAGPARR